ncbi:MAG: tetratricopeptide repeat protein [Candidatus Competibacteraceae bacterium]|nr:tetratricopeptide repeat protein [Candidatus Competibacteraceae bacterium]
MDLIERFEKLLADGQDNALLRFGLGSAYLKAGDCENAKRHLQAAVQHDPAYSAAWKALGKALTESGEISAAIAAYEQGIETAEKKGDVQAAKEMRVFLKRLNKTKG